MRAGRALTRAYAALNGVYWMLCCLAYSFSSSFLLGRGYSNSRLGLMVAAGYVLGLLLQPPAARLADRTARSPLAVIGAGTAAVLLTSAALLFLPAQGPVLTAVYVLFLALIIMLQPLVNAFAYYIEALGTPIPFGMCRAVGSLAYGLLAAVLGWVIQRRGVNVVPVTGAVTAAAMLALMGWFSGAGTPDRAAAAQRRTAGQSGRRLLGDRRFRALLASCVLLFFSHSFLSGYMLQIVQGVGGGERDMGFITGYVAVLELPAMFLFERLLRRFSCGQLLRFSAMFFAAKALLVLAAGSLAGIYAGMFCQLVSYALFIPASVRFAGELSGPENANRAQAYVTAMTTLGSVCASGFGGLLIDGAGLRPALAAVSASACAGALVMLGVGDRKHR